MFKGSNLGLLAAAVAACGLAGIGKANTVSVTPSNMGNWSLFTTDTNYGTPGGGHGTADMVSGPAPAPLGAGSAHLATASGYGDESAQLRDSGDWVGTNINSLTTLSYSTYCTASNAPPPTVSQDTFFVLYVNNSNATADGGGTDRLLFEPIYSDGNDVTNPSGNEAVPALNKWQNWDLLKGMWYSDQFGGPGSAALTWSQILADEGPNATIADDTADGLGGIRFTAGEGDSGDNFNVSIDDFSIGLPGRTTSYDFDPSPAPEPASIGLLGLGALGLVRRRKASAK